MKFKNFFFASALLLSSVVNAQVRLEIQATGENNKEITDLISLAKSDSCFREILDDVNRIAQNQGKRTEKLNEYGPVTIKIRYYQKAGETRFTRGSLTSPSKPIDTIYRRMLAVHINVNALPGQKPVNSPAVDYLGTKFEGSTIICEAGEKTVDCDSFTMRSKIQIPTITYIANKGECIGATTELYTRALNRFSDSSYQDTLAGIKKHLDSESDEDKRLRKAFAEINGTATISPSVVSDSSNSVGAR
ncbi:MAG: hypothetical protein IPM57_03275 [Oligoflexia bacterium]|nr:hypothetical protein [Oligoflexia bacterium]